MTLLEVLLQNDIGEGQVVEVELRLAGAYYWEKAHWKGSGDLILAWKQTIGSSTWVRSRGTGYTGRHREVT